jgi:hypothetical protein
MLGCKSIEHSKISKVSEVHFIQVLPKEWGAVVYKPCLPFSSFEAFVMVIDSTGSMSEGRWDIYTGLHECIANGVQVALFKIVSW